MCLSVCVCSQICGCNSKIGIYYTYFGGISNSNRNIQSFKLIVIVLNYTNFGGNSNINSIILIFKVIVINYITL